MADPTPIQEYRRFTVEWDGGDPIEKLNREAYAGWRVVEAFSPTDFLLVRDRRADPQTYG